MKVGFVGLGYRLAYLARVIAAEVPGTCFVGYVDPSPAGLPECRENGIDPGPALPDIAALAAAGPDLLMIGSPNHLHLQHIREGLEAGLKIFTEKPVVTTEAETFELLELLSRHGDPDRVMIGLVLRYAPLYRDLVAARDRGDLGTIVSIEASEHIAPYHGAFFMRDWRRQSGWSGGFMLEKCCHDIDLYLGLVGSRPSRIASFGGRRSFIPENAPEAAGTNDLEVYHRKPSGWMGADRVFDSDGDIIDFQTAIAEFETGEAMCFHTNLNVPDEFRRFCVIGARGMAEGDFVRNYFRVHDAHSGRKLVDKRYESSAISVHYGADEQMIRDIFAHLRDGEPLPVSILDGLAAGLTAIKMDEARASRRVIEMDETWQRFDSYRPGRRDVA